jgi:hypothetical protein
MGAAGIGDGRGQEGNSTVGLIWIRGGAVRAVGRDGAAVGAGYACTGF